MSTDIEQGLAPVPHRQRSSSDSDIKGDEKKEAPDVVFIKDVEKPDVVNDKSESSKCEIFVKNAMECKSSTHEELGEKIFELLYRDESEELKRKFRSNAGVFEHLGVIACREYGVSDDNCTFTIRSSNLRLIYDIKELHLRTYHIHDDYSPYRLFDGVRDMMKNYKTMSFISSVRNSWDLKGNLGSHTSNRQVYYTKWLINRILDPIIKENATIILKRIKECMEDKSADFPIESERVFEFSVDDLEFETLPQMRDPPYWKCCGSNTGVSRSKCLTRLYYVGPAIMTLYVVTVGVIAISDFVDDDDKDKCDLFWVVQIFAIAFSVLIALSQIVNKGVYRAQKGPYKQRKNKPIITADDTELVQVGNEDSYTTKGSPPLTRRCKFDDPVILTPDDTKKWSPNDTYEKIVAKGRENPWKGRDPDSTIDEYDRRHELVFNLSDCMIDRAKVQIILNRVSNYGKIDGCGTLTCGTVLACLGIPSAYTHDERA